MVICISGAQRICFELRPAGRQALLKAERSKETNHDSLETRKLNSSPSGSTVPLTQWKDIASQSAMLANLCKVCCFVQRSIAQA